MHPATTDQNLPNPVRLLILALLIGTSMMTSACATNRKIYDSQGVLVSEETIYKKHFWNRD